MTSIQTTRVLCRSNVYCNVDKDLQCEIEKTWKGKRGREGYTKKEKEKRETTEGGVCVGVWGGGGEGGAKSPRHEKQSTMNDHLFSKVWLGDFCVSKIATESPGRKPKREN
jgi:hypothetical protein